ncbi:MAG: KEOPS complex kinase/ATPase Bud32 [Candidatus Micrarchaeia archaeon]
MAMKLMAKGAEAEVYRTSIFGIDAVLKDRKPKPYRIKELDEGIRAARTRSEAKITYIADSIGVKVPNVLFVKRYQLFMTYVEGIQMSALMQQGDKISKALMAKVGKYLGKLHNAGIAHGDFTPANILVDTGGEPWVIDFGLSSILDSIEEKALDLLLMKRSIGKESYFAFIKSYSAEAHSSKAILSRLSEIESRGRYNERA